MCILVCLEHRIPVRLPIKHAPRLNFQATLRHSGSVCACQPACCSRCPLLYSFQFSDDSPVCLAIECIYAYRKRHLLAHMCTSLYLARLAKCGLCNRLHLLLALYTLLPHVCLKSLMQDLSYRFTSAVCAGASVWSVIKGLYWTGFHSVMH